ncbi:MULTISPECIES: LysR family transcriptional regulator [Pelosinus]|uniref:Transcriptional regulator, LysR family n=1 Tax=Pelosinus fermentans JBW45 TaxID=1192197 RepID=I9NJZ7_9FIRM|nr:MULTISPECIES: LysR family transcriptional regulator [Pelosinus]AJQ25712.1 transcriptional regulator, LysR family [Pelosinus fermentans JBW45]
MEFRQLKTFMSIVKLGNFSQAAQYLGYTQSSVTTHIQLLEKELNTILFERFGHQLMLTTDGERLYDYAEKITKLAEDAKNEFDHFEIPKGPIVIGMPESLCVYYLTDLLQEYTLLYPDVQLKVNFGIGSDFRNLLRKNMMDLAFFHEKHSSDMDLISTFLWDEPMGMLASPDHALAAYPKVQIKDLEEQRLIFMESGTAYQTALEEGLAKAEIVPKTILEICHIQTIKQMVINNLGITVLPLAAVAQEIKAGLLVELPWQGVELETNAYLAYHKDKWLSHGIRAFIRLVEERLLK